MRRTRLVGPQAELWPDWRHFAFITNRTEDIALVEAEHRDHAVVEQVIADLKDQALAHFPSGEFNANGAWTVLGALAHNLLRWTQLLGLPDSTVRAARTLRRRLLTIPGRLTRHGRALDTPPARPLALARRLHRRARPDPRAPRRLTAASALPETRQTLGPRGHQHACSITAHKTFPRSWLSTSLPRFPVEAGQAADLLMSSLYGWGSAESAPSTRR